MSFLQPSGTIIDLGVNIDHVATLRNARGTRYPDPIRAALLAELAPIASRCTCAKTAATSRMPTSSRWRRN
jgi:hypothetical protein